jgi:hypothetical protein
MDVPAKRYGIRRVNPFIGVMQVIETEHGRALSTNGVVWDIEIRIALGGGWGSLNQQRTHTGYCRYGLWSLDEGLVKRPLAPDFDDRQLGRNGDQLIALARESLQALPFPLADHQELWLFDQEEHPLALLAAVLPEATRPSPEPRRWQCSLSGDGLASQRRFPQAARLESLVKARAGFNICKRWVTRDAGGGGQFATRGELRQIDAFPPLLLTESWPQPEQAQLVRDYAAWVAPSLLTLQQLSANQRDWLEQQLPIQAASMEHHWRLYAEVVREERIKAARVQSRLQQAGANPP